MGNLFTDESPCLQLVASSQWLSMGWDTESCRRFRDCGREEGDTAEEIRPTNQPGEFLGKWPLATSPTGPGVAGEDLGGVSSN